MKRSILWGPLFLMFPQMSNLDPPLVGVGTAKKTNWRTRASYDWRSIWDTQLLQSYKVVSRLQCCLPATYLTVLKEQYASHVAPLVSSLHSTKQPKWWDLFNFFPLEYD